MKKKLLSLILIMLIALCAASCGTYEEVPEQTEVQRQAERFDLDEELFVNFYAACESIGMPEDTVQLNFLDPSEDGTSFQFRFYYESYSFTATADADYNITDIVSGSVIYMQAGTILLDVDYLPTSHQRTELKFQSEMDVKDNLISPATAEFPGRVLKDHEWHIYRDGNTFTVSSWVDSQNENGALLRYDFIATYDWDGTDDTEPVLIDVVISQ